MEYYSFHETILETTCRIIEKSILLTRRLSFNYLLNASSYFHFGQPIAFRVVLETQQSNEVTFLGIKPIIRREYIVMNNKSRNTFLMFSDYPYSHFDDPISGLMAQ
jgi:hypothetical protein